MSQSDPERRSRFERKRILRRLAYERDNPPAQPKRTQVGLHKQKVRNQKPKPPRKPEKREYGKRAPVEAKIILPTVGGLMQRGPIQFKRSMSPELKAAIKRKQIEELAKASVQKATELAAEEEKKNGGDS